MSEYDREMRRALALDAAKLEQLTGEPQPFHIDEGFFDIPSSAASVPPAGDEPTPSERESVRHSTHAATLIHRYEIALAAAEQRLRSTEATVTIVNEANAEFEQQVAALTEENEPRVWWMLEIPQTEVSPCRWWCGHRADAQAQVWSDSWADGVRFSRKIDAENVLRIMQFYTRERGRGIGYESLGVYVAEHMNMAGPNLAAIPDDRFDFKRLCAEKGNGRDVCVLDAGHSGAHTNVNGRQWSLAARPSSSGERNG